MADYIVPDRVVRNAQLDDSPVYFIGPYGPRVSFASQQQRALNVVAGLMGKGGVLSERRSVAVVGGGLAGVTAAVALLKAQQKHSVRLFEKNADVLIERAEVTHRYIHPALNFWPRNENHDPTTSLPFLDWFADTPKVVLKAVRERWRTHQGDLRGDEGDFSTRIVERRWDSAAKKVVLVDSEENETRFDVVLVACGFGREDNLGDPTQLTYWSPDDRVETDYRKRQNTRYLVSGTGDGGLIDSLRLVHNNFRRGYLIEDLIRELQASCEAAVDLIAEAEREAARLVDEHKADSREDVAVFYAGRYPAILDEFSRGANKLLDESYTTLEDGRRNWVRLVGQFTHPYEYTAAPIHRLMMAHAIKRERIVFVRGKLAFDVTAKRHTLDEGKGPALVDKNEEVIVRHGTAWLGATGDETIIRKDDDDLLRVRQRLDGALAAEEHYRTKFPEPTGDDLMDRTANRAEAASEPLHRQFGLDIDVDPDTQKFRVWTGAPPRDMDYWRGPDCKPDRIFGQQLVVDPRRRRPEDATDLTR